LSAAQQGKARRPRGAAESLATIVLGFESLVAFLGGLAVYGLKALPAGIEPWWGIVAGAAPALLTLLTPRAVRYRWGNRLGWVRPRIGALGALRAPMLTTGGRTFGPMTGHA
jgi:hypothetical protein